MFKALESGEVVLVPPSNQALMTSPDEVIAALDASEFVECQYNHDAISRYCKDPAAHSSIVVAKRINASMRVEVSDDKMRAIATLVTQQGGKPLTLDEAKAIIVRAGVSRGYKQIYLESLLDHQEFEPPGTEVSGDVALGRHPTPGKDSRLVKQVATLSDRLRQPKLLPDGRVDMRDFGKIASVRAGTTLIKQAPASPGKEGYTVTGEALSAEDGKSFQLVAGEGTEINKDNPLELIATVDGIPVEIEHGMRVDDIFSVDEVSVKTGHIEFDGSVVITKDVSPNMKVIASGDITVMGAVESGFLQAGGNIEVKQAVIGHLNHQDNDESLTAHIEAKGDVSLSHAQYTEIIGKNITIDKVVTHCQLSADETITLGAGDVPMGKMVGGAILNAQQVVAGMIGCDSGAKTQVFLAASAENITAESESLLGELAISKEQLDSLESAYIKTVKVPDEEKRQTLLEKINATRAHWEKQTEELEQKISALDNSLNLMVENAQITANKSLFSGVEIKILDKTFTTKRDYSACKVKLIENKVEVVFDN